MPNALTPIADVATQLRNYFLNRPFGAIRFWRFAVVRPHDQSFELVSTRIDGDRLDLSFVHASHQGTAGVLSIWSPQGLEISAKGVIVRRAARLRLDDSEAWLDGDSYRIRTPRGEGSFAISGTEALALEI